MNFSVFQKNTNVYRKETFTGVYTSFSSFIPLEYKFGLAYTLLYRCFILVSVFHVIHLSHNNSINPVITDMNQSESFLIQGYP